MTDPKKFVANLSLAPDNSENISLRGLSLASLESTESGKEQTYIDNKSLVSFVAAVPEQFRKDVLNSTLLAQRVADYFFPKNEDVLKWYDKYIEVITNVGWVIEKRDFAKYEDHSNAFEMQSAVISILTTLVGQNYALLIKDTLGAIKDLADDNKAIKVFEKNTHSLQKGHFQIGFVTEENGAVSMQIGAFLLDTKTNINKILFFKSDKDQTKLSFYALKCTLNEDVYSLIRNDILAKLGQSIPNYIAKLPDFN